MAALGLGSAVVLRWFWYAQTDLHSISLQLFSRDISQGHYCAVNLKPLFESLGGGVLVLPGRKTRPSLTQVPPSSRTHTQKNKLLNIPTGLSNLSSSTHTENNPKVLQRRADCWLNMLAACFEFQRPYLFFLLFADKDFVHGGLLTGRVNIQIKMLIRGNYTLKKGKATGKKSHRDICLQLVTWL